MTGKWVFRKKHTLLKAAKSHAANLNARDCDSEIRKVSGGYSLYYKPLKKKLTPVKVNSWKFVKRFSDINKVRSRASKINKKGYDCEIRETPSGFSLYSIPTRGNIQTIERSDYKRYRF